MNERIKELAAEAKIMTEESINMKISFSTQLKAFSEKFAELLIRECYESCKGQVLDKETADTNELTYNDAVGDCAIGLLQHFGMME